MEFISKVFGVLITLGLAALIGIFFIGVPAVWFFNYEPDAPLGIVSSVAGIVGMLAYVFYRESKEHK